MEENTENISPPAPHTTNSGHWYGPAIRRIPGWNSANSIRVRKNRAGSPSGKPSGRQQEREALHVAQRPLWLCLACAHPWPCGEARIRLLYEYAHDRISLRVYLASRMHESIRDLLTLDPDGAPTAEAFFDRFLAWAAPRTPRSSPRTEPQPP